MFDLILSTWTARKCPRCGDASWRGTCALCKTRPATIFLTPGGYRVQALGAYQGSIGEPIRRLKYQDETAWAAYLGIALQHVLPREWHHAVLIPVPLHPERLAERGFNQAALLARALARVTPLKVDHDWVSRIRHTRAQARLGKSARSGNLKEGFHCSPKSHRPEVILLDDVVTTGNTVDACAEALTFAGSRVIGVLACAVAQELTTPPQAASNDLRARTL